MKKTKTIVGAAVLATAFALGSAVPASAAQSAYFGGRECWWPDSPRMILTSSGSQDIKVYNDNGSISQGWWQHSGTSRTNSVTGNSQRATNGYAYTSAAYWNSAGWSTGCRLW